MFLASQHMRNLGTKVIQITCNCWKDEFGVCIRLQCAATNYDYMAFHICIVEKICVLCSRDITEGKLKWYGKKAQTEIIVETLNPDESNKYLHFSVK